MVVISITPIIDSGLESTEYNILYNYGKTYLNMLLAKMEFILSGQLTGKTTAITIYDHLDDALVFLYDYPPYDEDVIGFGVSSSHAIIYAYSYFLDCCYSPKIEFYYNKHAEATTFCDKSGPLARLSVSSFNSKLIIFFLTKITFSRNLHFFFSGMKLIIIQRTKF